MAMVGSGCIGLALALGGGIIAGIPGMFIGLLLAVPAAILFGMAVGRWSA